MNRLLLVLILFLALAAAACGGGNPDCKNACNKVSYCGLKSSGLSCDSTCAQGDCAACVDQTLCEDLITGKCALRCPNVAFTKK